ncbi:hypothetical protein ACJY8V_000978 [Escherichia coli]|nr:hypothetical protein [Escherichia coli]HCN8164533.1 hypothetical protein [Escherichia coli]
MAREILTLRKEREAAVPVAWRNKLSGWCGTVVMQGKSPLDCGFEPLYTAPPAQPVAVPDEMIPILSDGEIIGYERHGEKFSAIVGATWNACRAAMLKEAK